MPKAKSLANSQQLKLLMPNPNFEIVGVWEVIGVEQRDSGGVIRLPLGSPVGGHLIYTRSGHFSISARGAVSTKTSASSNAGPQKQLFFAGTFQRLTNKILHNIDVSSNAQWTGTTREFLLDSEADTIALHLLDDPLDRYPAKLIAVRKA